MSSESTSPTGAFVLTHSNWHRWWSDVSHYLHAQEVLEYVHPDSDKPIPDNNEEIRGRVRTARHEILGRVSNDLFTLIYSASSLRDELRILRTACRGLSDVALHEDLHETRRSFQNLSFNVKEDTLLSFAHRIRGLWTQLAFSKSFIENTFTDDDARECIVYALPNKHSFVRTVIGERAHGTDTVRGIIDFLIRESVRRKETRPDSGNNVSGHALSPQISRSRVSKPQNRGRNKQRGIKEYRDPFRADSNIYPECASCSWCHHSTHSLKHCDWLQIARVRGNVFQTDDGHWCFTPEFQERVSNRLGNPFRPRLRTLFPTQRAHFTAPHRVTYPFYTFDEAVKDDIQEFYVFAEGAGMRVPTIVPVAPEFDPHAIAYAL